MNYATTANRPNAAAAMGAIGVPALVGTVLIAGLAVNQIIAPPIPNPTGVPIEEVIEITPEIIEPDTASASNASAKPNEVTFTRPESEFTFELKKTAPIGTLPDLGDDLTAGLGPVDFGPPTPSPTPIIDPIAALPRGNPGRWITDNDYRPSWINRGFSGTASFLLEIDMQGRVSDCRITQSTGFIALDDATCRLIKRRARFDPATGPSGMPVTGSFASSVEWRIPE